jgi:hypothetical protein
MFAELFHNPMRGIQCRFFCTLLYFYTIIVPLHHKLPTIKAVFIYTFLIYYLAYIFNQHERDDNPVIFPNFMITLNEGVMYDTK